MDFPFAVSGQLGIATPVPRESLVVALERVLVRAGATEVRRAATKVDYVGELLNRPGKDVLVLLCDGGTLEVLGQDGGALSVAYRLRTKWLVMQGALFGGLAAMGLGTTAGIVAWLVAALLWVAVGRQLVVYSLGVLVRRAAAAVDAKTSATARAI